MRLYSPSPFFCCCFSFLFNENFELVSKQLVMKLLRNLLLDFW